MSRIAEEEPRTSRWPSSAWVSTIARSSGVRGPGFKQDVVGDRHLAHVVEGGRVTDPLAELAVHADRFGQQDGEAADPLDVLAGVLVPELDRHRQPPDGLGLGDLELGERVLELPGAAFVGLFQGHPRLLGGEPADRPGDDRQADQQRAHTRPRRRSRRR